MNKPIIVDYSFTSPFKGATIAFSHLGKGLKYINKQNIKEVCVVEHEDDTRHIVDFSFLTNAEFLETFHWLVKLSKKSDIDGIYSLVNLKDFRWATDNHFDIDFSKLTTIEILNINYRKGLMNLGTLKKLRELYVQSVKTDNLMFLSDLDSLEILRVIDGKFTSLEGLEYCQNLKKLDLRNCNSLIHAEATLQKLTHLESVSLDSVKNHDIDIKKLQSCIPHVWDSKVRFTK